MNAGSKPAFRRRSALALHELHHGPNMTPMVDVTMVILIFFMASASVLGPEWLLRSAVPSMKPAAAAATTEQIRRVDLSLRRINNETRAYNKEIGESNLAVVESTITHWCKEVGPDALAVVIKPDASVPYQDVVRLHELCVRLGITKVGLSEIDATPR
ncbi:MAG: biopolymer transporter ExbD [Planctomycetota bacterium]|jgi:biopolymer transport protein ExbD|nr:biopolymer transporter ExbD [Planctomycetota bacterium]